MHERARVLIERGEKEAAAELLRLGTSQLVQCNLAISDIAGYPKMADKSSLVPHFLEDPAEAT